MANSKIAQSLTKHNNLIKVSDYLAMEFVNSSGPVLFDFNGTYFMKSCPFVRDRLVPFY